MIARIVFVVFAFLACGSCYYNTGARIDAGVFPKTKSFVYVAEAGECKKFSILAASYMYEKIYELEFESRDDNQKMMWMPSDHLPYVELQGDEIARAVSCAREVLQRGRNNAEELFEIFSQWHVMSGCLSFSIFYYGELLPRFSKSGEEPFLRHIANDLIKAARYRNYPLMKHIMGNYDMDRLFRQREYHAGYGNLRSLNNPLFAIIQTGSLKAVGIVDGCIQQSVWYDRFLAPSIIQAAAGSANPLMLEAMLEKTKTVYPTGVPSDVLNKALATALLIPFDAGLNRGYSIKIVDKLLEMGADVDYMIEERNFRVPVLAFACAPMEYDAVYPLSASPSEMFRDVFPDEEIERGIGIRPTHVGKLPFVKCLVEYGANVNAIVIDNYTILDFAIGVGADREVVELLKSAGATNTVDLSCGSFLRDEKVL